MHAARSEYARRQRRVAAAAGGLAASPGMHRFVWDFRPTPPAGGRGGRGGGGGGGRGAPPPSAPGTYTVKLTVNGKSLTQPLTLARDPRSR